ncbi:trypsin-1-like [Odontomachus brunneus]|uniref:trypsin-1-like n=1 Tax=Odontomachus brunneus TaxID=486640 RepID=UPI0013F19443|nr:trypsin-1-like [Odontomachus brunneus]
MQTKCKSLRENRSTLSSTPELQKKCCGSVRINTSRASTRQKRGGVFSVFIFSRRIMLIRFILLLTFTALARPAAVDNELQSKSTALPSREKEQILNSSNKTASVDNDKGLVDWIYDIVVPKPPTITEPPQTIDQTTCPKCTCGLVNKQNRIVGGVETLVNQYPWMGMLLYRGQFYCGATVISSRYLLTASHCVNRFDLNQMTIRILEHDRNSTTESETQEYKVESVIKHSGYSTLNYNNDIALIKLKDSITFQGTMRPVCLPEAARTFAGSKGIVTGWGAIVEAGPVSQTLQEVTVPIISNAECRATNYPTRRITDNMICAGYKEGGKDSCQGDSGGPLHVEEDGSHQIVGIVSWGEGCAQPGYPGVYCRVNRYLTWIKRNTIDACYC